jgi:hypothetical protein
MNFIGKRRYVAAKVHRATEHNFSEESFAAGRNFPGKEQTPLEISLSVTWYRN